LTERAHPHKDQSTPQAKIDIFKIFLKLLNKFLLGLFEECETRNFTHEEIKLSQINLAVKSWDDWISSNFKRREKNENIFEIFSTN